MKTPFLFVLLALFALPAGSFAHEGSSSTGGGLPPKKLRFVCHTGPGPVTYRVIIPANAVGNDSRSFEASLYKIENQIENFVFSPEGGVSETVQVFRNEIVLEYQAQDVGSFFKLKVFPQTLQTSGPNQGAYRAKIFFDLTNGQQTIKVFDAHCFADITPTRNPNAR